MVDGQHVRQSEGDNVCEDKVLHAQLSRVGFERDAGRHAADRLRCHVLLSL